MAGRGMRTGGFVSAAMVGRVTGLAAGFRAWSEPPKDDVRRPGATTLADALRFFDQAGAAPFFAWIHLFDAHGPVKPPSRPPPEYLARFTTDDALRNWLLDRGAQERAASGPSTTTTTAPDRDRLASCCCRCRT